MQSEKSGKVISKIKVGKRKISIVFDDETLQISPDTYTEFRLYEGKSVSAKERSEIVNRDGVDKLLKSALVSVSRGHPTKKVMREKLTAKGATNEQVEVVINILTTSGLLDDQQFVKDYLEYAINKGYGPERIVQGLYEKGAPQYLIKELKFDSDEELKRAETLLPRLEEKYARYNYADRKRRIYESLIRLGYRSSIAVKLLDKIKKGSEKDELAHLRADYQKALRKYEDKGSKKIIEYLRGKGYRYNNIVKIMMEENHDEMD